MPTLEDQLYEVNCLLDGVRDDETLTDEQWQTGMRLLRNRRSEILRSIEAQS